MSNWNEVQKMMRDARTPKEKAEASQALAEHVSANKKGKNLVTMTKGGVNVVKLSNLPEAMQNPEVYDRVKKVVTGDRQ